MKFRLLNFEIVAVFFADFFSIIADKSFIHFVLAQVFLFSLIEVWPF